MKSLLALIVSLFFATSAQAALIAGDIAFTAFNADGNDDFAIVALTDIGANEIVFFTDNESDGVGGINGGEGALQWDSGASIIAAGTIIVFTDTDSGSNPGFAASLGTLTVDNGTQQLAGGGDNILAFQGTGTVPTMFIAGIQNSAGATTLAGTGLTEGSTFVTFTSGSSDDGGEYTGARTGEAAFSDYNALVNNPANWTTETSNGELILPIDGTRFEIGAAIPEPSTFAFLLIALGALGVTRRRT